MNNETLKNLKTLLKGKNGRLEQLLSKAAYLAAAEQALLPLLPPNIERYCQLGNITDHTLILLADNGTVATVLRMYKPTLMQKLTTQQLFARILHIEIKVRPKTTLYKRMRQAPVRKIELLGAETAKILEEYALSIDDKPLREAMLRIAKHRKG